MPETSSQEAQAEGGECTSGASTGSVQPRRTRRRNRDDGNSDEPAVKRRGLEATSTEGAGGQQGDPLPDLPELSLLVKWVSVTGKLRVSQLPLTLMRHGDDIAGLHKRLVTRVFMDSERPASLNDASYLKFSTSDECLNYPQDVAHTSFKLQALHDGWSYVIYESPTAPPTGAPEFVHVVSVEFETMARVIGQLGIRLHMIAYPIVAVQKAKLLELINQLQTDPNFKGIL